MIDHILQGKGRTMLTFTYCAKIALVKNRYLYKPMATPLTNPVTASNGLSSIVFITANGLLGAGSSYLGLINPR